MINIKDEILGGEPRYKIVDSAGAVISNNCSIELITQLIQEGTPLNKELFTDIGFHSGMILMWSGAITDIPTGWVLCDGNNGTPDLRDKFIVGAGSGYIVGASGGSNAVTLTSSQIPSHSHTASIEVSGNHRHTVEDVPVLQRDGTNGAWRITGVENSPKNYYTTYAGEHTHNITINNYGSGMSHENRPPYYALAYIMKI